MQTHIYVHKKIAAIVCATLSIENITIDKDLFESGVLDSMSLIQLMVELENSFKIIIPPEELNVDDYRSVRTMSDMIERLLFSSIKIENE